MPDNITIHTRTLIATDGPRFVEETTSTNDLALAAREDGAVFWAGRQTSGRGRHGARWESSPGKGLWFSVCLEGSPQGQQFAAVLAVRDAIAPMVDAKVKWPNDLLVNGRKLAGILVEHRGGWNAVGIGLNVNQGQLDFRPDLRQSASSIYIETGTAYPLEPLLQQILNALDTRIIALRAGGYIELRDEWASACDIVGKWVEREGVSGRVSDLDHDGALLIQNEVCISRIDHGTVIIHEEAPCSL